MQEFQTKYPLLWTLVFVISLLLLRRAWEAFLLVFSGVLFAIFLRGLTDRVAAHNRLTGGWAYTTVVTMLLAISGGSRFGCLRLA